MTALYILFIFAILGVAVLFVILTWPPSSNCIAEKKDWGTYDDSQGPPY